jgi:hypothetical protein
MSCSVITSLRRQDEIRGRDRGRIDTNEMEVGYGWVAEIDHRPRPLIRDVDRRGERGRRNPPRRDIEPILAAHRIGVKAIDRAIKGRHIHYNHIIARATVQDVVARGDVQDVVARPAVQAVGIGIPRERVVAGPSGDVLDGGERGEARGRPQGQGHRHRRCCGAIVHRINAVAQIGGDRFDVGDGAPGEGGECRTIEEDVERLVPVSPVIARVSMSAPPFTVSAPAPTV